MKKLLSGLANMGKPKDAKNSQNKSYEVPKMVYTIAAPGTIRANSNFHVSVNLHKSDGDEPIEIKIGIAGNSYSEFKTVKLEPLSTQLINFEIPNLEDDCYNLTAEGISGIEFKHKKELLYSLNEKIILIQTDKGTYKPEDLVRFRVLVLDEHTRPARTIKSINIFINDSENNRIKQFTNVELNKGVFSEKLQLAPFPNLGTWDIDVEVDGVKEYKTFEVKKYVLPKFEVKIDSKQHFLAEDGKVNINAKATYTYGKPVEGQATISIGPMWCFCHDKSIDKIERIVPLKDGMVTAIFDMKNDLDCKGNECYFTILASVKEQFTEVENNASSNITIHKTRCMIESDSTSRCYEYNIPYKVTLALKNHDCSPLVDDLNLVEISLRKDELYLPNPEYRKNCKIDENGIATAEFSLLPNPNDDENSYYTVHAKYLDQDTCVSSIYKRRPEYEEDYDIKIDAGAEKISLTKEVSIKISSKLDMKYFFYQIVGRGDILDSGLVRDIKSEEVRKYVLNIKPNFDMMPSAYIFVYFLNGHELICENLRINVEENFQNHINIETPEKVRPGEDVNLKVDTTPNSFVGLLGLDKSVLLLKDGNDIQADEIFQKLIRYRADVKWEHTEDELTTEMPCWESGLIVFTNAKLSYIAEHPIRKRKKMKKSKLLCADMMLDEAREAQECSVSKRVPTVRRNFVETWIWDNFENIDENGELRIKRKVPDTITSWVLTGFSINPETGIALTPCSKNIEVFQPFFVSTNLPYSVKRGEVIAIPAIVFNYQKNDIEVEITLENLNEDFDFVDSTENKNTKRHFMVNVEKNSSVSKSFLIRPKKIGHILLKLSAVSDLIGDAIEQKLLVEPEGVTEYVNKAVLLNLKDIDQDSREFAINVPEDVVPDSIFVEISVVGDLLGPTIQNIDKLVRKPYGCGEQNMVNFVPNILVLQYLLKIGLLTAEIETKAKNFLEIGYQRELTYKHKDGSYSAFGTMDKSGSTWLTAYVAKSFSQAAEFIKIDDNIIKEAIEFLIKNQSSNGSFVEVGELIDNSFPSNSLSITAYVILALLECRSKFPKYEGSIQKGLNFLSKSLNNKTDIFDYAIATFALQKGQHKNAKDAIENLKSFSRKQGDRELWSKNVDKMDEESINWNCRNADIELTAYGLLALFESGAGDETLPFIKWLISKRNSEGGFDSTQDTVVGLTALIKFAEKFTPSRTFNLEMSFSDNLGNEGTIVSNHENLLLLQTHIFESSPKVVTVNTKGSGSALLQVSYKYNIKKNEEAPRFNLNPVLKENLPKENLELTITTSFIPQEKEKVSNMVVMEISLPSGFVIDSENLKAIQKLDRVKMVETKNDDTVIVIYFNHLDNKKISAIIRGFMAHEVANQKPAPIVIYDYYDTSRQARVFYELPHVSVY